MSLQLPDNYDKSVIKSFKHDGSLHRMWLENWRIPAHKLLPEHAAAAMRVYLNDHTPIVECDGHRWVSRSPAVSFFLPGEWYNVVALIEEEGIRYYCNVASPPYYYDHVVTYIDYDLDVVVRLGEGMRVLDKEEYRRHRLLYRYGSQVEAAVEEGMRSLKNAVSRSAVPFDDHAVRRYYEDWKTARESGG